MKYLISILFLAWCAPVWGDVTTWSPNPPPAHNCSLLTIAHNGTVSLIRDITRKEANIIAKKIRTNDISGCEGQILGSECISRGIEPQEIERTEVFCG